VGNFVYLKSQIDTYNYSNPKLDYNTFSVFIKHFLGLNGGQLAKYSHFHYNKRTIVKDEVPTFAYKDQIPEKILPTRC
jgi:hypothetical protein